MTAAGKNAPLASLRTVAGPVVLAMVSAVLLGGAVSLAPAASAAADDADTSITIAWAGDTSSAKGDQPQRDPASVHYNDFKDLKVTVSQTKNLIDQAVRVTFSGLAPTRKDFDNADNAQNFLQAMQCWGPNPQAEDFAQTCQWGGRIPTILGRSVYFDNNNRVSPKDYTPYGLTSAGPTTGPENDNPFVTVDGRIVSGKAGLLNAGTPRASTFSPLLSIFGPSTTNEVPAVRSGADRTGYFDFETQSSIQSPQLGCGTAAHLKCWLVIVPRGSHFGGEPDNKQDGTECSDVTNRVGDTYAMGQANATQGGSPVNPKCHYFDNRIVVPLDFTPTKGSCPVGAPEFRVSGSQFMIAAMSSWQPALCQSVSSTFSFATNPDSVARAQLLETKKGSPELVYSGYPVSSGELGTSDERTLLGKTSLQYAPVGVSSVVVAYNAEFTNGRPGDLVITPRIMAKLLTQSYLFTVPVNDGPRAFAHLSEAARSYLYLNMDPDFQRANPTNWEKFELNPSLVLPGPAGADGIKQVWRWILADKDAVAFLNGEEDPDGMTVNPYYLPKQVNPADGPLIPWFIDDTGKDVQI